MGITEDLARLRAEEDARKAATTPAGGTPPPTTTPVVPHTTPIPGGSAIAQATEMAKVKYQQRLADLGKQRSGVMLQSGFMGDTDPETGLTTNLRTDPYNKYGQFQLLNRAQAIRSQQTQGENIDRGLGGGGGLAAQNLGNAQFQSGQEDASFGQSLNDMLMGLTRNQQDSRYEYDQALWQAQQEAARQAQEDANFPYYPGADGDPGGDPNDPGGDPNDPGSQDPSIGSQVNDYLNRVLGNNQKKKNPPGTVAKAMQAMARRGGLPGVKKAPAVRRGGGGGPSRVM